ncbi:MAG: PRC-barrel domain-containing protein [archaeon]
MVVNEQEMSEIMGKDIFTDKGSYCGKIADVEFDLSKFRLRAIVVDAAKGSYLAGVVGGKRGVIIPYPMIRAIDDIAIIKHISAPEAMNE